MFEDITNDGTDHWSPAGGSLPQLSLAPPTTINVDVEHDIEEVDETELEESLASAKGK